MILDKKLIIRMQVVEEITVIPDGFKKEQNIVAERELGRAETYSHSGVMQLFSQVPMLSTVLRSKL